MPEDTGSKKIDEASDSLNTGKFYILLLFVSVIGIIGALMMIAFIFLQDALTAILWKDIPVDSLTPVFNPIILVICVVGGLGAGVIRHYFKGEIAIMAEDLIEFNEKGRFTPKRGLELFLPDWSPLSAVLRSARRHRLRSPPVQWAAPLRRKPVCLPRWSPFQRSLPSVAFLGHSSPHRLPGHSSSLRPPLRKES